MFDHNDLSCSEQSQRLASPARVSITLVYLSIRYAPSRLRFLARLIRCRETVPWLRTNGVNTNGAAAKVMTFDSLGKKVRPGTLGNIKVGYQE